MKNFLENSPNINISRDQVPLTDRFLVLLTYVGKTDTENFTSFFSCFDSDLGKTLHLFKLACNIIGLSECWILHLQSQKVFIDYFNCK